MMNKPTQPKTWASPCALIAWTDTARNEPFRPIVQSSQAPQLAPAESTTAIPARK